ncbi:LamG domain-containing protein [Streptomyces sp. NBC_01210]|uniref:LamG domain-containing protein n=1 Tax=Streptomyces sp. NBC_01210 TaxID=2903774 RepID=UPI002E0E5E01|nr:LamG domain-containing protein [Streptomyces sp. NBC_01210]
MSEHRWRGARAWGAMVGATLLVGVLSTPAFGAVSDSADDPVPLAPRITSEGPYTECTANDCAGQGEPGLAGMFTFRPNAVDIDPETGKTDVAGYRVRLQTEPGATEVSGAEPPPYAVVPTVAGTQVLEVQAKDWGERWGAPAYFTFQVKPASGTVGHWQFADRPTAPAVTTTKDTATEGTKRHDATLKGGATWSDRARRGDGDYSLDLNSTDSDKRKAYAATAKPVVDTKESFTVSVWAYLAGTKSDQVVLSAPGSQDATFELYYSAKQKKWAFGRGAQDHGDTADVVSYGDAANPPARVWTHLTGVFDSKRDTDKTNDTVQLFVNGRPQGQPVNLSAEAAAYEPWSSTKGLQIGRTKDDGSYQRYFHGYVDEAAVWHRALRPVDVRAVSELTAEGGPATALVADWNAGLSTGSEIKDVSGYAKPGLTLSAEGAQLRADESGRRQLVLDGIQGHAATPGPAMDESGSFTVSARVRVDSAGWAAKPSGYRAIAAGQRLADESSWALVLRKIDQDVSVWSFEKTAVDAAGKVTERVVVQADNIMEPSEFDTPIHISGVYDAAATTSGEPDASGKLKLYIGSSPQNENPHAGRTSQAQGTGELAVGRGADGGTMDHYLPGGLDRLRIWTGAMTANGLAQELESGAAG